MQLFELNSFGQLRCGEVDCVTVDDENVIKIVPCPLANEITPKHLQWESKDMNQVSKVWFATILRLWKV